MGKSAPNPSKTDSESERPAHPRAQAAAPTRPAIPALGNLGVAMLPSQRPNDAEAQKLGPQEDDRRWATASQAPQDFVPGVKEGDRTALNTKEYVFFGYFQRIRARLDHAWVPILRAKLTRFYRAGRQLASEMDYRTRVLVYLNSKGEIIRVQMVSESGATDLDDSAISAFNEAGPFPNPPKGIIDRNGEIQIPWEFVLKT
jgi:protein TonB